MSADDMYKGFARDSHQARSYAEEAERRWGKGVRESNERVKKLSDVEWAAIGKQGHEATVAMAALMAAGVKPDSRRAIDAIDAHHKWICNFWTPNREAYTALGAMYVQDERFRAHYEGVAAGLAEYVRDAIAAYAAARLS